MRNNKPLGSKSYGSIPHLRGSKMGTTDKRCELGQELIATKKSRDWRDLVIVQEKLDGSNVAVARINGELVAITRAGYTAETSPHLQHMEFYCWMNDNKYLFQWLKEGQRVCGEWMYQAHGIKYDLPHGYFVAFDIMTGKERMTYINFLKNVSAYLPTPRLIHIGHPVTLKRVIKMLEPSGHGAQGKCEGAIWRVEREGKVDFLLKYVRPDHPTGKFLPDISGEAAVINNYTIQH